MTNLKKHNDKYKNYILFFTQMIMTNIMTKKPMFSVASRVPHPLYHRALSLVRHRNPVMFREMPSLWRNYGQILSPRPRLQIAAYCPTQLHPQQTLRLDDQSKLEPDKRDDAHLPWSGATR